MQGLKSHTNADNVTVCGLLGECFGDGGVEGQITPLSRWSASAWPEMSDIITPP